MTLVANYARNESDPKIVKTGPSSQTVWDRMAKGLGWFSIGLGAAQLIAPRRFTRSLGLEGFEPFVRLCGVRGLGTGLVTLSPDKTAGVWGRVAGDALDIATLVAAVHPGNRQRGTAKLALAAVGAVTLLDALVAGGLTARHRRPSTQPRSYRHRTGYPGGLSASRGAARGRIPDEMHSAARNPQRQAEMSKA
jgi:hypothetical protein